jgi:hypothetical protein
MGFNLVFKSSLHLYNTEGLFLVAQETPFELADGRYITSPSSDMSMFRDIIVTNGKASLVTVGPKGTEIVSANSYSIKTFFEVNYLLGYIRDGKLYLGDDQIALSKKEN